MSAPEPRKPFIYIVVAGVVMLLCCGMGVGGMAWFFSRGKKPKTFSSRPGSPNTPPGKNQRFELDYPEKALKEERSGNRAPRDTEASSRPLSPLPANDLFADGKFPINYNPNGTFRKLEAAGVRSFTFNANGAFAIEGTPELKAPNKRETNGGFDADGSFNITGNVLKLTFNNGEVKELNIKPFEVFRDRTQSLLIDGEIFNRVTEK